MEARTWHRTAMAPTPKIPAPPGKAPYPSEYLDDLQDALVEITLPSTRSQRIATAMTGVVHRNLRRPPGSQDILSLSAPFSAGKSTFAIQWGGQIHREILGTSHISLPAWNPTNNVSADLIPVVYVTLISDSGVKELNSQILSFLGYPAEGTARVTATRVVAALARHGVRLLILDDVHMLRTSEKVSRTVLDYLKFLNTELGALNGTLMLVGANIDDMPILSDPQIKGRLRPFRLDPFPLTNNATAREWQRFLRGAEELLLPATPWIETGTFSSTHARLIHLRTQGYPGDTAQLLTDVTWNVARHHKPTVTSDDIEAITLSARAQENQASLVDRPA